MPIERLPLIFCCKQQCLLGFKIIYMLIKCDIYFHLAILLLMAVGDDVILKAHLFNLRSDLCLYNELFQLLNPMLLVKT